MMKVTTCGLDLAKSVPGGFDTGASIPCWRDWPVQVKPCYATLDGASRRRITIRTGLNHKVLEDRAASYPTRSAR
jgi:hypothetical protein